MAFPSLVFSIVSRLMTWTESYRENSVGIVWLTSRSKMQFGSVTSTRIFFLKQASYYIAPSLSLRLCYFNHPHFPCFSLPLTSIWPADGSVRGKSCTTLPTFRSAARAETCTPWSSQRPSRTTQAAIPVWLQTPAAQKRRLPRCSLKVRSAWWRSPNGLGLKPGSPGKHSQGRRLNGGVLKPRFSIKLLMSTVVPFILKHFSYINLNLFKIQSIHLIFGFTNREWEHIEIAYLSARAKLIMI